MAKKKNSINIKMEDKDYFKTQFKQNKKRNFWYIVFDCENFKEFCMVYGWAILVVLVAIGALAWFGVIGTENFREQRFCEVVNPDKCICEEYDDFCKEGYEITDVVLIHQFYESHTLRCCTNRGRNCYETEKQCVKSHRLTEQELEIKKCQDYPDNEDCKCTETKLDKYIDENCSENDTFCFLEQYVRAMDEMRFSYIVGNSYQFCLKSRQKTECEKGNLDWVEEKTYSTQLNNSCFNECAREFTKIYPNIDECFEIIDEPFKETRCGATVRRVCNEQCEYKTINQTICREKTIYDFSCAELKKPLFFGSIYNFKIKEGKLIEIGIFYDSAREDVFTKQELYDILIEKGCEI